MKQELKNFDMLTFTLARSRHHSKGHEIGYVVVVRTMAAGVLGALITYSTSGDEL